MKAKTIYETIKHLPGRSKEELEPYEHYKDWKPDGALTLNNWGGVEIKLIDNNEAVEYRYNFGNENEWNIPIEAEIEYGIDEDDDSKDEEGNPIFKPYFLIGDDKYFLDQFMRIDR
jgi:hypothetical protein